MIICNGLYELPGVLLKLSVSSGSDGNVYIAQVRAAFNKFYEVGEFGPIVDMPGEVAGFGLDAIFANGFSALRYTRLDSKNF